MLMSELWTLYAAPYPGLFTSSIAPHTRLSTIQWIAVFLLPGKKKQKVTKQPLGELRPWKTSSSVWRFL